MKNQIQSATKEFTMTNKMKATIKKKIINVMMAAVDGAPQGWYEGDTIWCFAEDDFDAVADDILKIFENS